MSTRRDKAVSPLVLLVDSAQVELRITNGNFVSISAEVKKDKEEKSGRRVVLKETYYGSASRGFSLAHEIDAKGVVAKLEDGVLKLTLSEREGGNGKTIQIQ